MSPILHIPLHRRIVQQSLIQLHQSCLLFKRVDNQVDSNDVPRIDMKVGKEVKLRVFRLLLRREIPLVQLAAGRGNDRGETDVRASSSSFLLITVNADTARVDNPHRRNSRNPRVRNLLRDDILRGRDELPGCTREFTHVIYLHVGDGSRERPADGGFECGEHLDGAVEGEVRAPETPSVLEADFFEERVGDAGVGLHVRDHLAEDGGDARGEGNTKDVCDGGGVEDDGAAHEVGDGADEGHEVCFEGDIDFDGGVGLRGGSKVDAELGDNAEVGLEEEPIEAGTKAAFVEGERFVVCHGAGAGPEELSGRKDYLHAALRLGVLAVGSVAEATIEGVAEDGSPANGGNGGPEMEALALNLVIEIEEGNAGLDDGIAVFAIDLDDAIHAVQIQNHGSLDDGTGASISQIPAAGDGPQRNLVCVGEPDNFLDLFSGFGSDGAGGLVIRRGREGITVGI